MQPPKKAPPKPKKPAPVAVQPTKMSRIAVAMTTPPLKKQRNPG